MQVIFVLCLAAAASANPLFGQPKTINRSPHRAFYGERIIGGVEASPGEFPHQLSYEWTPNGVDFYHVCGAVLMHEGIAVTAAHCMDGDTKSDMRIKYGTHNRVSSFEGTINAFKLTMHPAWDSVGIYNDVGLILFDGTVPLTANTGIIGMAREGEDHTTQSCTLSGWGYTVPGGAVSDILMKVDMPIITNAECTTRMQACNCGIDLVDAGEICAYAASGDKSSCQGDSGGPMTCYQAGVPRLAGVTSWGLSNSVGCMQTFPSVYARIGHYAAWIHAESNQLIPLG